MCEDKKLFGPLSMESFLLSEWSLVFFAARTTVELGTWIIFRRVGWFLLFKSFCIVLRKHKNAFSGLWFCRISYLRVDRSLTAIFAMSSILL